MQTELNESKPAAKRPWTTPVLVEIPFEEIATKGVVNPPENEGADSRPS